VQVFVSHCDPDHAFVGRLISGLRAAGFQVWDQDDLVPGENPNSARANALDSSELMVAVFTRESVKSQTVRQEVQYALTAGNYRGRVVPVLVGIPTYAAGDDVPWVLLRMDPIHLDDYASELGPVILRVQELAKTECNAP
jgi:hypothetical protein